MIAFEIEGRGKRTLTIVGPADISIASLISLVSVDAATSVCCLVSSMTWAYRCWLERNTANRGLSVVPFSCTPQNPLAVQKSNPKVYNVQISPPNLWSWSFLFPLTTFYG